MKKNLLLLCVILNFCYAYPQDDMEAYNKVIENGKEYLLAGAGRSERFPDLNKIIIKNGYDESGSPVTLDGIESGGKTIVPCIYNCIIEVCVADENDEGYCFRCVNKKNGKYYDDYRDKNGRLFPISETENKFQRIRYVLGNDICYRYWKFDDKNGWEEIGHFSKWDKSKVKVMGILDENLNWIISPNAGYEYIIPLEVKATKYYRVGKTVDGVKLWGLLDSNGIEILPVNSKYMWRNYDEETGIIYYSMTDKMGYYGAIDLKGNWIVPFSKKFHSASGIQLANGKYFICKKNGLYGLYDKNFNEVISPDFDELSGFEDTNYLKFKLNGFWGVMSLQSNTGTTKTIIPTTRGYTSIDRYIKSQKRFTYTMSGYKGECNHLGQQLSKIKVATPQQAVATSTSTSSGSSSTSSNSSTATNSSSSSNSNNGTTTVVVEHHRDPIPMQEWQACWACGGMGTMGCDNCGGSGTKYIGDRLHRCSRCNGGGIIPCNICHGNKGQYTTVYR